MLKEAIEHLIAAGRRTATVQHVYDYGDLDAVLVTGLGDKAEIIECRKPPIARAHTFQTLEGFVGYLSSEHCKAGVVFVQDASVIADLAYGASLNQNAFLNLAGSEQFKAFKRILFPNQTMQRTLWRELISDLADSVDPSLGLYIRQIAVDAKSTEKVSIDETGVSNRDNAASLAVTFPAKNGKGDQTATIPVDWTWKGRIWECFEAEYEIPMRLEIVTDNGLEFTFHAPGLDRIVRLARLDLVAKLIELLPKTFQTYEGSYGPMTRVATNDIPKAVSPKF